MVSMASSPPASAAEIERRNPRKPDERVPRAALGLLGLQHVLVMYAGAVAIPLIIGRALKLPPEQVAMLVSADLFACGIVTLIQSWGLPGIGIRMPVMMGVTFAAVGPMLSMGTNPAIGLTGIYGAVIASGLFGLVASFHGIIMGYARQIFALARAGFLPGVFARVHPRFQTPHIATVAGGIVGIAAIYSDNLISVAGQSLTASIVTMAVFGALTMYVMSMAALFRLRRREPNLARPYRAPLYPYAPAFALVMALVCLVALVVYNPLIFSIFAATMGAAVLAVRLVAKPAVPSPAPAA